MADPLLVVETAGEEETAAVGVRLAPRLRRGDIVGLSGALGTGKSVLARAVLRRLMDDSELAVPSPSFTLVQTYEPAHGPPAWHVDLYRLNAPDELIELGLDEAYEQAITLIEWPERAGEILPTDRLTIRIERTGEGTRRLAFEGDARWADRLRGLGESEA